MTWNSGPSLSGPGPDGARCLLCDPPAVIDGILKHLRLAHPNQYVTLETWPDGGLVITDLTLEPEDFGGEP